MIKLIKLKSIKKPIFQLLSYNCYIKAVEAHKQAIISMSLKHRLMYTGSSDGTAKCWVTEFGDNTVTYKGHDLSVTVLKFYKGLCKFNKSYCILKTDKTIIYHRFDE